MLVFQWISHKFYQSLRWNNLQSGWREIHCYHAVVVDFPCWFQPGVQLIYRAFSYCLLSQWPVCLWATFSCRCEVSCRYSSPLDRPSKYEVKDICAKSIPYFIPLYSQPWHPHQTKAVSGGQQLEFPSKEQWHSMHYAVHCWTDVTLCQLGSMIGDYFKALYGNALVYVLIISFSLWLFLMLSTADTSSWSDRKGPTWHEVSLMPVASSVKMRSSILPLAWALVVTCWVRPSAMSVLLNMTTALEHISLKCILSTPVWHYL